MASPYSAGIGAGMEDRVTAQGEISNTESGSVAAGEAAFRAIGWQCFSGTGTFAG
jgi:hypothetical protein